MADRGGRSGLAEDVGHRERHVSQRLGRQVRVTSVHIGIAVPALGGLTVDVDPLGGQVDQPDLGDAGVGVARTLASRSKAAEVSATSTSSRTSPG